ncbi:sulfotransferase [Lentimicrobium sp. S6]|uniref:sulfotransferase n=1 Tax=Lentimicrobium sp. S6 TaxID=2735872 RepID=UPI001551D54B|nr:sulfotransferase [Lentimicrobium sp. S6]NPD47862.1 hypothetical protein [Lentimicrobium sp. S6]
MKKKNFVIIAHPRSGSNLLVSLLRSHPEINCKGELFNRINLVECDKLFQDYQRIDSVLIKTKGFKMPFSFRSSNKNNIWEKVKSDESFKIIHLSRSNLLRAYVSMKIASKTKSWFGNKDNNKSVVDKQCILDAQECVSWINNTTRRQKKIEYDFRYHHSYALTYENLMLNKNTIKDLLHFLDVDTHVDLSTKLEKQNKEPISKLIINYEEFRNGIQNSVWSDFLGEDQDLEFK